MNVFGRLAAIVAMLCLCLAASPAQAAKKTDRIGDIKSSANKVRVDKANGKTVWGKVGPRTKVVLVTKAGTRVQTDVNALGRGATVLKTKKQGNKIKTLVVQAKGATGGTDCSFDTSSDDVDKVDDDMSFDCTHGYDDGKIDTDSDCSYDSESESDEEESSTEMSWDCSYSEDNAKDDDQALEWDCSFEAESSRATEAGASESESELGFDCSWEGAETDTPLWDCTFLAGELGFLCTSEQLDQEFGYTFDVTDQSFVGGMDFQADLLDGDDSPNGVNCAKAGAGAYDCSFDAEIETGDCEVEWDFDRSRSVREGDVSGSLSYACSSESDSESETEGGADDL